MDWGKARLGEKREMSVCWLILKRVCLPACLPTCHPSIQAKITNLLIRSENTKTSPLRHRFYKANVSIFSISLKHVPWLRKAYVITIKEERFLSHILYSSIKNIYRSTLKVFSPLLLSLPYPYDCVCVCVCVWRGDTCVITYTIAKSQFLFQILFWPFNKDSHALRITDYITRERAGWEHKAIPLRNEQISINCPNHLNFYLSAYYKLRWYN